jgi:ubiquinone/menaquinone biosynthesis C-methylase UbiE
LKQLKRPLSDITLYDGGSGQPMEEAMSTAKVDRDDLEAKVKDMYRQVALDPQGEFHFEMGRALAERLGYAAADLDCIPPSAIDSFAGVGYHFGLASLRASEAVLDLGSGSGMDSFIAALKVGRTGDVVGLDMTDEQRAKAQRLGVEAGFTNVTYVKGYIEEIPLDAGRFDVVVSNGVINLSPDKPAVFREAARVLKHGGRLALSDIVTEVPLPDGIVCNATLWAACIGGAMQQDDYRAVIERAGFAVERVQENPQYRFLSSNAQGAAKKYGVKSVSLLAVRR